MQVVAQAPPEFEFFELPELPGGESHAQHTFSGPDSVIRVVGSSMDAAMREKPVMWSMSMHGAPNLEMLPTLEGQEGTGAAHGVYVDTWQFVVGQSPDSSSRPQPVLWERPGDDPWMVKVLPTLPGDEGGAMSVHGSNGIVIAGWTSTLMEQRKAAVWEYDGESPPALTVLPALAGQIGEARSITAQGEVAAFGWSLDASGMRKPVFWMQDGPDWLLTPLPTLGGGQGEVDHGFVLVDSAGVHPPVMAGRSSTKSGDWHAARWTLDGMWQVTDLETLNETFTESRATVSDQVVAVGTSVSGDQERVATLWHDEGGVFVPYDLNTLVVNLLTLDLLEATSAFTGTEHSWTLWGEIVGVGQAPIPEPSTGPTPRHAWLLMWPPSSGSVEERGSPSDQNVLTALPNPFRRQAHLSFALPSRSFVRLTVHDVEGRLVETLVDGVRGPGIHHLSWEGTNESGGRIAPGVYFIRLDLGGRLHRTKVILED